MTNQTRLCVQFPRHPRNANRLAMLGIAGLLALHSTASVAASGICNGDSAYERAPSTLSLRVDNDMFGANGQDQGYTNGVKLSWMSPNLASYTQDPCLPASARAVNSYLTWLHPQGFEQQNMVVSFAHALFTPLDYSRSDLIEDDRPYAAALLASFGFNARSGDTLHATHLSVGIIGPAALGKPIQHGVHKITGSHKFHGWDNQLHNEPVFLLAHERMHRFPGSSQRGAWGWDAIGHWGAGVGNLATYANLGGEIRYGFRLPDDFGSTPLRLAGENTAPPRTYSKNSGWSGHLFASINGKAVLRDITLDGNTFRNSHSVSKRHFVADIGYGLSLSYNEWKLTIARYHRTREFRGQKETPVFGSVTLSRQF